MLFQITVDEIGQFALYPIGTAPTDENLFGEVEAESLPEIPNDYTFNPYEMMVGQTFSSNTGEPFVTTRV